MKKVLVRMETDLGGGQTERRWATSVAANGQVMSSTLSRGRAAELDPAAGERVLAWLGRLKKKPRGLKLFLEDYEDDDVGNS